MELVSPAATVTVPSRYQPLPKGVVEEPEKVNTGLPELLSEIEQSPLTGVPVDCT